MIGEGVTLPRDRLPLELLLAEPWTLKQLTASGGVLLLTPTPADAVAVRALGAPAAPYGDLARMKTARLLEFSKQQQQPYRQLPPLKPRAKSVCIDGLKIQVDGYMGERPADRRLSPAASRGDQELIDAVNVEVARSSRPRPLTLIPRLRAWARRRRRLRRRRPARSALRLSTPCGARAGRAAPRAGRPQRRSAGA